MLPMKTRPLFDETALSNRIKELGAKIEQDFGNEPITVVGVLKGSFIFLSDLVRSIKNPMKIEFIGVSSYHGTESTGHVRITQDLTAEIRGKNVLLVEDIIDTGLTMDYLINTFKVREPKKLKICTLLSKPESHMMKTHVDYVGFEISNEFVIGYGLDLNGDYRNLPYIAQVISD
jgi:hypoxanthine phosphoribosyltransferase